MWCSGGSYSKGQCVACWKDRRWKQTRNKKMGPRKHGDSGGVAGGKAECSREARKKPRGAQWNCVQEVGNHMIVCTTGEEISKLRTHMDSLAQAVSIQHPASSIQLARSPARYRVGFGRAGRWTRLQGSSVSQSGSECVMSRGWARAIHIEPWGWVLVLVVGGNTARGASSPVDPSSNLSLNKPLCGPPNP